jgi:hypothetical protein
MKKYLLVMVISLISFTSYCQYSLLDETKEDALKIIKEVPIFSNVSDSIINGLWYIVANRETETYHWYLNDKNQIYQCQRIIPKDKIFLLIANMDVAYSKVNDNQWSDTIANVEIYHYLTNNGDGTYTLTSWKNSIGAHKIPTPDSSALVPAAPNPHSK